MSTEALQDAVKTRISPALRQRLIEEAGRRELKVADIVREALREYFDRKGHPDSKGEVAA